MAAGAFRCGSGLANVPTAGPSSPTARDQLGALLAMADFTTPHRFLETILSGPMDGRRKLYSRLGMAARDPDRRTARERASSSSIRKSRRSTASSPGSRAATWRSSATRRRRANAVRVMTVHGAKGLEAPIVILADATADPAKLGGVSRTLDFPVPDVGKCPAHPPAQGRAYLALRGDHRRRGGPRPGGALAAALRRPDPSRRAAGRSPVSSPR